MAIPFGRYHLLKKLASGGMGQVFLARIGDEGFEKLVVIKRILPHLVEDEEFFTMFRDEARITMRLNHPNIAQIFEFGVERGVHFLAMEYVAGEDVRRLSKRIAAHDQSMPLGVILRIIADAAAGLDYAHKAKDSKGQKLDLIHRDISPQNILVGFDGGVKLIDFGVAKAAGRAQHTATGILKGKFPYMSPEQAEGYELDARSDVFALGIVLWELLTGRRLFKGDNDVMTQRLVKECQVPPPSQLQASLPASLDAVVLKALQKNRDDRYPDAASLRLALEEFALQNSIPASSAHLVAFVQPLYKDRMELEQKPEQLDELTSETELDWGVGTSNPKPPPEAGVGITIAPEAGALTKTTAERSKSKPGTEVVARDTGKDQDLGQALDAIVSVRGGSGKFIAGIIVLTMALGIGYFALKPKPGADRPIEPPKPVVADTPKPPPLVNPPKPQEQPKLSFRIESEPLGAQVEWVGQRVLGVTPVDVALERNNLPGLLRFTADGYEPQQQNISESQGATLSVQLKKKRAAVTPTVVKPPDIKTNR